MAGGTDVKILKGLDGLLLPRPIAACQSLRLPVRFPPSSSTRPETSFFILSFHRSGLVSGSTLTCARQFDIVTGGRSETRRRMETRERGTGRQGTQSAARGGVGVGVEARWWW